MVREKKANPAPTEQPAKKTKSSGARKAKGKPSAYNMFMKKELARLREEDPDAKHPDRFKQAAQNWKKAKENPINAS
ncbi:hypothetical protein BD410DRAFT_782120 [Rickenella mellea]|uniref:YABBY protein C-terminal domain-containing protein n=1 Tax=Rickenella mellea TaxID=50990 RepID=A0A4Y7QLN8_9AGAM|nr:hypothetical protein BD410DRAFT_782120 [Rickenella mellea]